MKRNKKELKMKNLHLIPINVLDLVDKLNASDVMENERGNYLLRLETIRDYCNQAIMKHLNAKPIDWTKNKMINPKTRNKRQ